MDQSRLQELKKEVNEDDSKAEKIAELRRKLADHPFIVWKSTDEKTLVSCLRSSKYDVEKALKKFENLLIFSVHFKDYIIWEAEHIEVSMKLLNQGIIVPLKQRDVFDRQVIIFNIGEHDPNEAPLSDLIRTFWQTIFMLQVDETTSLTGFVFIFNGSGMGMQHLPGLRDLKFVANSSKTTLTRIKLTILYNFPMFMSWTVKMAKSFLSVKMRKRVEVVNSVKELHEILQPNSILPTSLDGEEKIVNLIESVESLWKSEKSLKLAKNFGESFVRIDKVPKKLWISY